MNIAPRRDKRIIEEASLWAAMLEDGPLPADERERLADWLRESPHHLRELLITKAILEDADGIDPESRISVDALITEAGADIVDLTSATLPARKPQSLSPIRRPVKRFVYSAIAASFAIMAVAGIFLSGGSLFSFSPHDTDTIVATTLGEQRSLPLDDGSIVHLNTMSKVRVRYESGERAIDLIDGEALFEVAHDPLRPFRVYAGDAVAEALGTIFNVHLIGDEAEVAVIEGRVALSKKEVENAAAPETMDSVMLAAGEEAASSARAPQLIANLEAVSAWRERKIIFERATLSEIAIEFNRYNHTKIIVEGRPGDGPRFSGVFSADDPEAFLTTIALSGRAEITRRGPGRALIRTTPPTDAP